MKQYLLSLARTFNVAGGKGDEMITEGQLHIFGSIILRPKNRIQIICSTQYGKSLWVALACIVLTCVFKKVVVVVAPSTEKAKIIMRYYINHLGDDKTYYSKLEKNSKLDRLKQEETKQRIMLNNGGGIFIISTDEKNSSKNIESAMGQGAEVVIGDEYCLVGDSTESTIFRMIAGKGADACYIKIGNPFYSAPPNSHFFKTWLDFDKYMRIFIDYEQALKEGRYQKDFVEEARDKPMFDILYECLFPDISVMDKDGYLPLILPDEIKFGVTPEIMRQAMKKNKEENSGKLSIRPKLGCDIGGGGDENKRVLRWGKMACVIGTNRSRDTMVNVTEIEKDMAEWGILAEDVNIDDIGIGRGVSDRLKEKGHEVNAVSVGDRAMFDPEKFYNLKAELCWTAREWLKKDDTRVDENNGWIQLTWLKYKTLSDRKVIIEPKERLKQRYKRSPDQAEAFYLTFAEKQFVGFF